MLVLTRKINETIDIVCPNGSVITVHALPVHERGRLVRLGIVAPAGYWIDRSEPLSQESSDRMRFQASNVRHSNGALRNGPNQDDQA